MFYNLLSNHHYLETIGIAFFDYLCNLKQERMWSIL